MKKECLNCKLEKEHHAKGLCYSCYKKLKWQPKIQSCKRCKRQMATHAKGLCAGCYNYIFHLDKNRAYNQRKKNNISLKVYRETIKKCVLCEFNKIIDVQIDQTDQGLAAGQFAVFYSGDFCLGCGVIK